jgi:hypothetical protein
MDNNLENLIKDLKILEKNRNDINILDYKDKIDELELEHLDDQINKITKQIKELYHDNKIDPTDRIHTSNDPNLVFKDVPLYEQRIDSKPVGLWYSFGKQWFDYAKREDFRLTKYTYKLNITDCNILTIDNVEKFEDFEKKYGYAKFYGNIISKNYEIIIDWAKVASDYDGIEIYNPKDYTALEDLPNSSHIQKFGNWYYYWDIGSGCIWKQCKINLDKLYFDPISQKKKS